MRWRNWFASTSSLNLIQKTGSNATTDDDDGVWSVRSTPIGERKIRRQQQAESTAEKNKPRTVKQHKNKRKRRQLEKLQRQQSDGQRWKRLSMPSDLDVLPDNTVQSLRPSVKPAAADDSFQERAVDCDGLNTFNIPNKRLSQWQTAEQHIDGTRTWSEKSKFQKPKLKSLSQLFDRRQKSKFYYQPSTEEEEEDGVRSAAIDRIGDRDRGPSTTTTTTTDVDRNENDSEDDRIVTDLGRSESIGAPDRLSPSLMSESIKSIWSDYRHWPTYESAEEFRRALTKGWWTSGGGETEAPRPKSGRKCSTTIDSGYDSPEVAPKMTDNGRQRRGQPDRESIRIDSKFVDSYATEHASQFNKYFQEETNCDQEVIYGSVGSPVEVWPDGDKDCTDAEVKGRRSSDLSTAGRSAVSPCSPHRRAAVAGKDISSLTSSLLNSSIYARPNKISTSDRAGSTGESSLSTASTDRGIVVAIDLGTCFSGYAYAFRKDKQVYVMRGLNFNDSLGFGGKYPSVLLLEPEGRFHSFGAEARDNYHDLEPEQARRYLYFERFKLKIGTDSNLKVGAKIAASNGQLWPAVDILTHCLRFLRRQALAELGECVGSYVDASHVQWVVTVPSIWTEAAKQLMRLACYEARIGTKDEPDQLLIAFEPEAASIYCRHLKQNETLPQVTPPRNFLSLPSSSGRSYQRKVYRTDLQAVQMEPGNVSILVDCGGGTVDVTVHQLAADGRSLVELYKGQGGVHGSCEIDRAFESVLCEIFGTDFIEEFRRQYSAAYNDLMASFESRKRAAHPYKDGSFNISLPFAFLDVYKKKLGHRVDCAVRNYNSKLVSWNSQAMLRLSSEMMTSMFLPAMTSIVKLIDDVVANVRTTISYLFLVGGFAESAMLQQEIHRRFDDSFKVIIPNRMGWAVLQGAVMYGLDPSQVQVRRSRMTYGIGVLHPFDPSRHPVEKLVTKNDRDWCVDVFEKFVSVDEPVGRGEETVRHYCPASNDQREIVIHVYSSASREPRFVTDDDVRRCATLKMTLPASNDRVDRTGREIKTGMRFGDTELTFTAIDLTTGHSVSSSVDFLH